MNWTPIGERVIVKLLPKKKQEGVIVVPESATKLDPEEVEVMAISPDSWNGNNIKVGDHALLGNAYKGGKIKLDGAEYIICMIEDLLCYEKNS